VGSFSGNGLSDPVFEAEGNVYQCYSVVIWGFGFLNYYQIGRDVVPTSTGTRTVCAGMQRDQTLC